MFTTRGVLRKRDYKKRGGAKNDQRGANCTGLVRYGQLQAGGFDAMKRGLIIGGLIIIALMVMLILYLELMPAPAEKVESSETATPGFLVVSQGADYLKEMQAGMRIGSSLPKLVVTNINGKPVDLSQTGKKLLLVFAKSGYSSFLSYSPLLQEWAKIYGEKLQVIVFFDGISSVGESNGLTGAGVEVVQKAREIFAQFDPNYMNYNYLVNERGQIVSRYQFSPSQWHSLSLAMDKFARKSVVPEMPPVRPLQFGHLLQLRTGTDARGNRFAPASFAGKPTVFFLIKPCQHLQGPLTQLMRGVRERFGEKINVVAMYYFKNDLEKQAEGEYYCRYGITPQKCCDQEGMNPWKLLKEKSVRGVMSYFDQNGQIFEESSFWTWPTVLFVDDRLNLRNIIGLTPDNNQGINRVTDMIIREIASME